VCARDRIGVLAAAARANADRRSSVCYSDGGKMSGAKVRQPSL
jgi:hypothetical protein